MCEISSPEFPELTLSDFESFLTSDDLLVHYFNDFLSLSSFMEMLMYNQNTGLFEIESGAADLVSERIKQVLKHSKSQLQTGDPTGLRSPLADNHYTVCCLDREHGMQWIKLERVPFFLQSDCYHEYRLSKLLLQNRCHQWEINESFRSNVSTPQQHKANSLNHTQRLPGASEEHLGKPNTQSFQSLEEHLAEQVVRDAIKRAIHQIDGEKSRNTKSAGEGKKKLKNAEQDEKSLKVEIRETQQRHTHRLRLDDFRMFLKETPGENLLNLWIDIERLKSTETRERKNRCLVLMRYSYLMASSRSHLTAEMLLRLGLTSSLCWTEDKLSSIQHILIQSLLAYWIPRFWTSQKVQQIPHNSLFIGHRSEDCFTSCSTPQNYSVHAPLLSSGGHPQSSGGITEMLEALCAESCAGSYFTKFCEQSGKQLWVNAIYFWMDLQHYHDLFYSDGLDPYRVQREAQFLFSTYVVGSTERSIDVDERIQRDVYEKLQPAYEELFDEVEERALSILEEPWTLLHNRDKESFQKVCFQEEERCIENQDFKELQKLYKEIKQVKLNTVSSSSFSPSAFFPKGSKRLCGHRESQRYTLSSLLEKPDVIGSFMSFLQNHNASIHLTFLLDLDQYRKTSHKDRMERSSIIAAKYLNSNYFFGSSSPATTKQKNRIRRLTGGAEGLTSKCLSNPVAMEIQDIIRKHIEEAWLPLFVSSAEFKFQKEADGLSRRIRHHRKARREAWKAGGSWMNLSKENLLFRRVLLDPSTCQQFQHFVSLKGDFLENDVHFWLEVQRYKDLCHSHSDDSTIQHKISTIISCFINSTMPPALQIDIPPEQAQNILEGRHKLGPYIFREAQMSVFGELLKFWPEFQELRSGIQEERLLPLLEEKRAKHRARLRRQKRKEEEQQERDERRRAQEEQEREEMKSREEDEEMGDEGQDERSKLSRSRMQRRPKTPEQSMLWSYSKYMADLLKEEKQLRRTNQSNASFSSLSDSSTDVCVKSASCRERTVSHTPAP